jgi:hypothetical protein
MPRPLYEPNEFQRTIHYPLCITLYIETTGDLLLTKFQPTITALHSICRDDSRPSAALLRCEFQLNSNWLFNALFSVCGDDS